MKRWVMATLCGAAVATLGLLCVTYLKLLPLLDSGDPVQVHNGRAILAGMAVDGYKMFFAGGLFSAIYLVPLISYLFRFIGRWPMGFLVAALVSYLPIGVYAMISLLRARDVTMFEALMDSQRETMVLLAAGIAVAYYLSRRLTPHPVDAARPLR